LGRQFNTESAKRQQQRGKVSWGSHWPTSTQPSPVSAAAMYATLGDVLTMGGDFHGAEAAFVQAATHPDFTGRAAAGLARVYAKLGRYPDAVAQLKIAAAFSKAAPATGTK